MAGPLGPYVTIAGLVLDQLGRLAVEGDLVTLDGYEILVTAMERRAIASVRVTVPLPGEGLGS